MPRTRAYRPEALGRLEGRSLLSGGAGLSADPVVLPHRQLNKVADQVRVSFLLYARDIEVNHLSDELHDILVMIPFGRVDGLGAEVNRIVDRLDHDLAAKVPRAVATRSAQAAVLTANRAEVQARIRAGDVVVR